MLFRSLRKAEAALAGENPGAAVQMNSAVEAVSNPVGFHLVSER